jgi:hypothetical protein
MAVSPTNNNKVANRVATSESGFKRLESRESRDAGKPEIAFNSEPKVQAPKVRLKGNPFFAARADMYRGMTAAQKVELMSKIEKCRPDIVKAYGEKAYEHAAAVLLEAIEFTA